MSWYYADNGRQAGPVDDASFDALVRQGAIRQDTLVWKEGMSNWQPLSAVRPPAPAPAPAPMPAPPPPAAAAPFTPEFQATQTIDPSPQSYQPQPQQQAYQPQQSYQPQPQQSYQPQYQQPAQQSFQPQQPAGGVTCANCGQMFAASDVVFIGNSYVCAGCKPVFLQRMREGGAPAAVGARRYGGFWIRFAAALIDGIIIGVAGAIITYPITFAVASVFNNAFMIIAISGLLTLVRMAMGAAYSGYFLSTKGATPGKQLLGLQVIRSDGSGITFMRGACRYLAQIISALILLLGYIIAAFDNERRTLHDHLCDTRVVYR